MSVQRFFATIFHEKTVTSLVFMPTPMPCGWASVWMNS